MEWAVVILAVVVAAALLARRSLRHYKRSTAADCPPDGCPVGCGDCAPAAKLSSDIDTALEARRDLPNQPQAQGK